MSLTVELFSDIFARQDNSLARLDARVKLVIAAAALMAVICSTRLLLPLSVLAICIGATAAVGVPAQLISVRMAAPLLFTSVLVALKTFLNHVPFPFAIPVAARCLAAVAVVLLLSSVTPAHRIFYASRALGMPRGWVEVALLMYRYTFIFIELATDIVCSQRVRLGYSGLRRGLSSLSIAAGTLIVRSLDQAERTNEAMQVRGYAGDMPFAPMPALLRRDWLIMGGSVFILAGMFCLAEVYAR